MAAGKLFFYVSLFMTLPGLLFDAAARLVRGAYASQAVDLSHFVNTKDGGTYIIASWIMKIVDWLLGIFGLADNQTVVTVLYAAVVFGVSLLVGYLAQLIIFPVVRQLGKHWGTDLYTALLGQRFFVKVCRIVPALVFLILIQFTLSNHNGLSSALTRITVIYVVFVTAVALSALIVAVWQHVDARENKKKLPLKGLAQLAKGIVWIIAAIVVVAIIVNKSPASLLAGLGAFAAVLMLVFKDSILGVVAGVQLSENDSLHVGDWIKVDSAGANGTVTEVSLVSVKVLNWDKTTTTLPPYSLISGSFTNYRTMQRSHTRRIQRSLNIDADSILPATPEMLDNIRKVPFMDEYITKKLEQKAKGREYPVDNPAGLVDGTIDTNLGLFRAYLKMWLDANPDISHTDDCFISTLAQTPSGIPLQVYCFTATSSWFPYEGIQDAVMEHVAAMLRFFMLYTFENPSGRDTVIDGFLSQAGNNIEEVYGIPYPFFQDPQAPNAPASTRVRPRTGAPSASAAPASAQGVKQGGGVEAPDGKGVA